MESPLERGAQIASGMFESRSAPGAGGAYTRITDGRYNADPALAPMRRSSGGANTPIPEWLHNAG